MDGILNNNRVIVLITILCILISCKDKHESAEVKQKIIEHNFLEIIDTIAYKYGTFRPLPPIPGSKKETLYLHPKLFVYLCKKVTNKSSLEKKIKDFFKKTKLYDNKYDNLISNNENADFTFDSKFPKKIGKYRISFDTLNPTRIKFAGKIVISNFKIDKSLGYFIVELSDGPKSEIGFVIVMEKINNKWVITRRELLYMS